MDGIDRDSDREEELLFDWDGTHQPVVDVNALLAGQENSATDNLLELWARRAAKLAQAPPEEESGEQISLVLVRLGREIYGLDARHVWSIKPLEQITRVPRVPNWVAGVVNLRGRIYSVIDLRRFFGLPASQDGAGVPSLIVVETPEMELGLLVDEVLGVEATPLGRIQEAEGTVRGLRPEYVLGVTEYRGRDGTRSAHMVVLDLPTLLADERLVIHEEVT
jgi:purine-binding chemotaxis protein CheW